MNYYCTVCGNTVTPAAHQYCIKNEYPVMCHQHQQEYGLNRYHVLTDMEKEVAKETADKEKEEREQREEQRKLIAIPLIEDLIKKIVIGREYGYSKFLLQDVEKARKENLITPEQYNQYIAVYYANKEKKALNIKQKAEIWNNEVNKEIETLVNETIKKYDLESDVLMKIKEAYKLLEPITNKYDYIEEDKEEYFFSFLRQLQDITESYYYESDDVIKFGYKM